MGYPSVLVTPYSAGVRAAMQALLSSSSGKPKLLSHQPVRTPIGSLHAGTALPDHHCKIGVGEPGSEQTCVERGGVEVRGGVNRDHQQSFTACVL
jgi:hypothetical protein